MYKFKEGQYVSVSIKALYESEMPLTYGAIVPDYDEKGEINYYDLYNEDGEFACCDGEICYIEQAGVVLLTLVNNEGESTVRITLTRDEAKEALFVIE